MASEVLGVLAFARETQKRRKCGPKKAESLHAMASQGSRFPQWRFNCYLTIFSEWPHPSRSLHFQQNTHIACKTLQSPVPRLFKTEAVLHKSLSKPKIWSELKI